MIDNVLMLSLTDPWGLRDGGTLRNRATFACLEQASCQVEVSYPEPRGLEVGHEGRLMGAAREVKRSLLPMPTSLGARDRDFARRVAASDADVLHVSALSQAQYHRATDAKLWLDFMDLWSSFARRESASRRGLARATARAQGAYLGRIERHHASRAHLVTAAGWSDCEVLREWGLTVEWLPTTLPDDEFKLVPRTRGSGPAAGFLGNFNYWPNRDAYHLLRTFWAPRLNEMGWRVIVAGLGSERLPASEDANIELIGPVDSLDDYYARVDVSLAPIALGGGIKVKVIESLARGVPVVGTAFAFDGFPPSHAPLLQTVDLERPDFSVVTDLHRFDPLTQPLVRVFMHSDASSRFAEWLGTEERWRDG